MTSKIKMASWKLSCLSKVNCLSVPLKKLPTTAQIIVNCHSAHYFFLPKASQIKCVRSVSFVLGHDLAYSIKYTQRVYFWIWWTKQTKQKRKDTYRHKPTYILNICVGPSICHTIHSNFSKPACSKPCQSVMPWKRHSSSPLICTKTAAASLTQSAPSLHGSTSWC